MLAYDNPWFHEGKFARGIGGPHVGENKIWPMGLVMQALTSDDDKEIINCLTMPMISDNFERMIHLAEQVFATKNDPDQLDVNPHVIERLLKIHPSSVSEYDDGNGPAAWILLIPTTTDLMQQFLENKISEKELFEITPLNTNYEALYLCSAMVLEEYRRKGIARRLALAAIENIRRNHPIKSLFVWPFSNEGDQASETLACLTSLPLYKRAIR